MTGPTQPANRAGAIDPRWADLGLTLFGVTSAALGLIDLLWLRFAVVWQPVPQDLPGLSAVTITAGSALLLGGLSVQFPRSRRLGAAALCLPYAVFTLLWAKRVVLFPSIFATWSGTAEQLVLLLAAALVWVGATPKRTGGAVLERYARAILGLCALSFGVAHFVSLSETAAMVPTWIPGGGRFWALATGFADLLAGAALLAGVRALLATRLLAAMYAVFAALVWLPAVVAAPHDQLAWAGTAVTLAMAAAVVFVGEPRRTDAG